MRIRFLGANRQVSGSRYCLAAGGKKILIDCGMFQERQVAGRNWDPCPVPPEEIDAVLLTHVHIDHSGCLPRLVKEGFRGPIYATRPSVELAEVMLRDSARIQSEDAAYKRRRHRKEGRQKEVDPLYTEENVDDCLPLFRRVNYRQPVDIEGVFSVVFHDAGHILGSAMLEVNVLEAGTSTRFLFSGDIGQWDKPLIRDPSLFEWADYVIMESTYGDRNHTPGGDIETQLGDLINDTVRRGGNVIIPTFAVERAQELMYYIGRLVHADRIPDIAVFLDSPMAIDVTEIFRHFHDCFDDETWELIVSDEPPLRFPGLHLARSVEESRAINKWKMPCIIMATSGMCTAGRIKHHLRQNISRPETTVAFVGYQGRGTLGRQILQGDKEVRIHGRTWPVRARIEQIFGFSGHADRDALLRWIGNLKSPPRRIFLTHGDEEPARSLQREIEKQFNWPVSVPDYLDDYDLDPAPEDGDRG